MYRCCGLYPSFFLPANMAWNRAQMGIQSGSGNPAHRSALHCMGQPSVKNGRTTSGQKKSLLLTLTVKNGRLCCGPKPPGGGPVHPSLMFGRLAAKKLDSSPCSNWSSPDGRTINRPINTQPMDPNSAHIHIHT